MGLSRRGLRASGYCTGSSAGTSSVQTLNTSRVLGPNAVLMATSAASRPRAINILPMRRWLLRGSKVCQAPPI